MRLLKRREDGGVELTDHPSKIPAYAILSHTWGHKDEEVSFVDIRQGIGQLKSGFQKIDFCGKQAATDGLDYFWVDTCCIDKDSSAELQEAITSMFFWYRKATKCYVYLSDVISDQDERRRNSPHRTWEPAFRKSRWFTRGWTLQELLAPQCVEFFSVDGKKLGDRVSLEQLLYGITGIAIEALRGADLSSFGIEERMSWSKGRETTREEDEAYSLIGIFDVSLIANYGERRHSAMKRLLQEIRRPVGLDRDGLVTEDGILESLNFVLKGDREEDITPRAPKTFTWIFDSQTSQFPHWLKAERVQGREETTTNDAAATKSGLFWIKGKPGCGKSTLMKYIQGQPETKSLLGEWAGGGSVLCASYYFWYQGSKLQKSQEGMLRSILHTCLDRRRELIAIVTRFLAKVRPDELSEFWNLLRLKETLKKVLSNSQAGDSKVKFCFFVDGLDEYVGDHEELAKFVVEIARLPQVKLCISSRPLNAFERELGFGISSHIILQKRTSRDILQYIEGKFDNSPEMKRISTQEPSVRPRLTSKIARKASGVFVWVHLVVKLLLEGAKNGYSSSQLEHHLDSYPDELDALYQLIIGRVNKSELKYCFRYLRFVEVTGGRLSLLLLTVADILLDEPSTLKSFNDKTQLQGAKNRINSCCLGLLEIGGKRRTGDEELVEASVFFLHKSVFDYLGTDGAQQQTINFKAISPIPERHLMNATLRLLEIRYPEARRMQRRIWFSSIRPHAMTFLRLARTMEEKTGICELKLIDKLEEKLTKLWEFVYFRLPEEQAGDIHWVRAIESTNGMAAYLSEITRVPEGMPSNLPPKHGMHSFVLYAYKFGLHLYAKEKGFDNEVYKASRYCSLKAGQSTNITEDPQRPVHLSQDIHPALPCKMGDAVDDTPNTTDSEHQPQEYINVSTSVMLDHSDRAGQSKRKSSEAGAIHVPTYVALDYPDRMEQAKQVSLEGETIAEVKPRQSTQSEGPATTTTRDTGARRPKHDVASKPSTPIYSQVVTTAERDHQHKHKHRHRHRHKKRHRHGHPSRRVHSARPSHRPSERSTTSVSSKRASYGLEDDYGGDGCGCVVL
ncbi:heterokaryon incompatibility protein-domain-containing protein [Xylaria grammica]|nr:heterokaryon incompatibility protein-domain-containing protein [Xylaria grammica]